ncbi:glycoside hydrolase family 130 protein [Aquihabitans sp. McL0605]|uniref:glycoside hydrolase family 130 protein n=1 Tax=Aquihabitans sp. McL0605 TaxID=3415671 RepID=UPI003CED010D
MSDPSWALGPFEREPAMGIRPAPELTFDCPVSGETVAWAAKDVFNPGAVVHEGRVHLLVRAEDAVGRYAGVSRIGLATSDDGIHFELEPEPVLHPDDDAWQAWEWPGGCEDPRVVEAPDGGFVCTYTAFDGKNGALFVATSPDLRQWTKHGPAFAGTRYAKSTSKSGAVLTEVVDGRLVAARRDGRYWMYWGEGTAAAASSTDLVRWEPVTYEAGRDRYLTFDPASPGFGLERVPGHHELRPLLFPRRGRFDSLLVEPGPPAVTTDDGIVLIYNGANHWEDGDPSLPAFSYQPGQALFDQQDPLSPIARTTEPMLRPEGDDEERGQVGNVCFAQGLVLHRDRWHLYYGMADSRIGCATAPVR